MERSLGSEFDTMPGDISDEFGMPTNSFDADEPSRESQRRADATEETTGFSLSRRQTIRTGGLLGAGGLLGLASVGTDTAAANSGSPDEIIHLDYDAHDDWDELYRVSTGDPENLSFVSSPTVSGSTSLEMRIREGDHWGASTHYDFEDGLLELNGRVSFSLGSDWSMDDRELAVCRLWNCAIARGEASAGGGDPDGTNGWSNRMYVTTRGTESEGPYHLLSNTYHMDRGDEEYGDHDYIVDGEEYALAQPEIVPGQWYEFEYHVRVNTVSGGEPNADGVVRYWLDGDPVYERENFRFTTDRTDNVVDSTGPVGHYGGQYTAPTTLYAYYDDHSMALGGTFDSDARDP
jgi:hypothetical protein